MGILFLSKRGESLYSPPAPVYYTVTSSSDGNSSLSQEGALSVLSGDSLTLNASVSLGYVSTGLVVDGVNIGVQAAYTFNNVIANHSISIASQIQTFIIAASADANSTITPSGNVSVNYEANQSFTCAPNSGYSISDVVVDGGSVGPLLSYSFNTVTANHTIAVSSSYNSVADPYFSSVVWLLHFDNNVTDVKGHTNTNNGLSFTSVSKYGSHAIIVAAPGTVVSSASADFAIGTGDFTLECWVKKITNSGVKYILSFGSSNTGVLFFNGANIAYYDPAIGVANNVYVGTPIDSVSYHHVAICRTGGVVKAFLDGNMWASATGTYNIATNTVQVSNAGSPSNCHLDDVRLTRVARYSANFTPPGGAFSDF